MRKMYTDPRERDCCDEPAKAFTPGEFIGDEVGDWVVPGELALKNGRRENLPPELDRLAEGWTGGGPN